MASSSSVVKPTPTGPQVFICFRGADVRSHFISFLDPALREANINVFIDEDEHLGSDLVHLLKRIEDSEIALVIFSENFTSSYWCLEELAKIKECKDQGRLIVIPIFYKVKPSVVKYLTGKFGDNFRELKRNNLHMPQRTQKWKEALVSIPESIGMPLAEQSEKTDKDFITSMVIKIQKLLDYIVSKRNKEIEANRQGVPIVPAREQEREASHQGGSVVPSMVTHFDKPQRWWTWSTINEAPKSMASSSDAWMREYNEALKLSEDINGMMSERNTSGLTGPDAARRASAIRRKITIFGTRLDNLQSLLVKQRVSEKEMNRRKDMVGNLRSKANQWASAMNMSNRDELWELEKTVMSTKQICLDIIDHRGAHSGEGNNERLGKSIRGFAEEEDSEGDRGFAVVDGV